MTKGPATAAEPKKGDLRGFLRGRLKRSPKFTLQDVLSGTSPSWRRYLLEESRERRLIAASGEGDYTEGERELARQLLYKEAQKLRWPRRVFRWRFLRGLGLGIGIGGVLNISVTLPRLDEGTAKNKYLLDEQIKAGEGMLILEEEAGLFLPETEDFYQATRAEHEKNSYRKSLVDDDRVDAIYANIKTRLLSTCRGEYRGLRGFQREYSKGLGKDIGRTLANNETGRVFYLVNKMSLPIRFVSTKDVKKAMKIMKMDMEKEGYEPTMYVIDWREDIGKMDTWGLPIYKWKKMHPFIEFEEVIYNLALIKEPHLTPGRIYCLDFKSFCKIRYRADYSLDFGWYKRAGSPDDEIIFAAFNPCEVTVKDPRAARYIEIYPHNEGAVAD